MNSKFTLVFLVLMGSAARAWAEICNSAFDGVFIADESGSIGQDNWNNNVIPGITAFVNNYDISADTARLAIVSFSSDLNVRVSLDDSASTDKSELLKIVKGMDADFGGTDAFAAFQHLKNVQLPIHRIRNKQRKAEGKSSVPLISVVFTDGATINKDETLKLSNDIRNSDSDVTFICFGVGNYDKDFMKKLCKDNNLIFEAKEFSQMIQVIKQIADKVCETAVTNAPTLPTKTKNPTVRSTRNPSFKPTPDPTKKPDSKSPTTPNPTTVILTSTMSPTFKEEDKSWMYVFFVLLLPLLCCAKCRIIKNPKQDKKVPKDKSAIAGAQGVAGYNFYGDLGRGWSEQAHVPGITLTGSKESQEAQRKAHEGKVSAVKSNYAPTSLIVPNAPAKQKNISEMTASEAIQFMIDKANKGLCPSCGCKRVHKPAKIKQPGALSELASVFKKREKKNPRASAPVPRSNPVKAEEKSHATKFKQGSLKNKPPR